MSAEINANGSLRRLDCDGISLNLFVGNEVEGGPANLYLRSDHDHPMSENTINMALRRMGYPKEVMTGHGFRAMARTVLDEVLGFRPVWIEHQLAHAVRDPNGRAYNRTAHLDQRRKMLQAWADYLDSLKNGAEIIPLTRSA